MIESWGKKYESQGKAILLRTPPPMRIIKPYKAGSWVAVMSEGGPPDYTMLLRREGADPLPVIAEAKNNDSGRWAFHNLKPHQADKLSKWNELGGFACIILFHKPKNLGIVVHWGMLKKSWEAWYEMKTKGRRCPPGRGSLSFAAMIMMGEEFKPSEGFYEAMLWCSERCVSGA